MYLCSVSPVLNVADSYAVTFTVSSHLGSQVPKQNLLLSLAAVALLVFAIPLAVATSTEPVMGNFVSLMSLYSAGNIDVCIVLVSHELAYAGRSSRSHSAAHPSSHTCPILDVIRPARNSLEALHVLHY